MRFVVHINALAPCTCLLGFEIDSNCCQDLFQPELLVGRLVMGILQAGLVNSASYPFSLEAEEFGAIEGAAKRRWSLEQIVLVM